MGDRDGGFLDEIHFLWLWWRVRKRLQAFGDHTTHILFVHIYKYQINWNTHYPCALTTTMLYIYEAQCLLSNANNNQIVRRVHFPAPLLALSFFSTSTLSDALTWNNLTFLMKSIASATRHKNYCNFSGKKSTIWYT